MKRGAHAIGGVLLFLVGAVIVWIQFGHLALHLYRMPSASMEPTLLCSRPGPGCSAGTSDRVVVPRWHPFWTPSRGDLVVFRTPPLTLERCGEGGTFLKRLIGLPGETVSERRGHIFIDGKPLHEPYVKYPDRQSGTWHVPAGGYFVLGDNRPQSCDSRQWGSVPGKNLIGPVVVRYWPFDRIGVL